MFVPEWRTEWLVYARWRMSILFIYCFSFLIRSFTPKGYVDPPYMATNNTKEKGNQLRPSVVTTTKEILRPQPCAVRKARGMSPPEQKRKRKDVKFGLSPPLVPPPSLPLPTRSTDPSSPPALDPRPSRLPTPDSSRNLNKRRSHLGLERRTRMPPGFLRSHASSRST